MSPYPIILSIENHCSLPQQQRLAQIMKSVLGPMLAYPMTPSNQRSGFRQLPSPAELERKVLVKGKRIGDAPVEDEEDDDEEDDGSSKNSKKGRLTSVKSGKSHGHGEKVHPELSEITYLSTGKVHDFDPTGNLTIPCDNMCSFSEGTTLKTLKKASKVNGWILHNANHLRYDISCYIAKIVEVDFILMLVLLFVFVFVLVEFTPRELALIPLIMILLRHGQQAITWLPSTTKLQMFRCM